MKDSVSPCPHQYVELGLFFVFVFSVILVGLPWPHTVILICIYLMINKVKIFCAFISHLDVLLQFFCSLSIFLFHFIFVLSYRSCFYTQERSFYWLNVLHISSLSVASLLSFKSLKNIFLFLMQSNL